jgi:hypothetical protein
MLDEGVQFIQKPFTAQGLATKVRKVFDNYRITEDGKLNL